MNWFGTIVGFLIGRFLFGGALGSLVGAVLGSRLFRAGSSGDGPSWGRSFPGGFSHGTRESRHGGARHDGVSPRHALRNEATLLAALSAMLAKLAKADGVITPDEIHNVEAIFADLGLSSERRAYCIDIFRRAKDDGHTVFDYARDFAAAQRNPEVRQFVYELLWDLAAADGKLTPAEDDILRRLPAHLRIWPDLYRYQFRRHVGERAGSGERRRGEAPPRGDSLDDCYALLGCRPDATDAEVKRAYRDKAKKNHPDELQNQGLPPEFLQRATEQMARINDAYARIRKERGFK